MVVMNGDLNLVVTLVERLSTRLPHRTGSTSHDFTRDEIVVLTRGTLVGVSSSSITVVLDTLITLLEELSRQYKNVQGHPSHILYSELYILELIGECCTTHWERVNALRARARRQEDDTDSDSDESEARFQESMGTTAQQQKQRRATRNRPLVRDAAPEALPDALLRRLVDMIKLFSRPVQETFVLPPWNILDDVFRNMPSSDVNDEKALLEESNGTAQTNGIGAGQLLLEGTEAIDAYIREIVEYISYSNWPRLLDYLKSALQQASHQVSGKDSQSNNLSEEDRNALVTLKLMSCYWVDGRKLSIIIQELCGCFLHLRKSFQTTVATVLPLLVTRWLERNPKEFMELHSLRKRLDGGAETLFDMSNTMFDGGKRKMLLYPFQTSLLLLLPDVFEVASNMRENKSSSITKKVSFLESLRKALRNRNETSIYCLTTILRVARHFPLESEAAILSYALDVQEEVREAVFRRYSPGFDAQSIDKDLMTATFVSLTHLSFESCIENLVPLCLSPNSPQDFKIAVVCACTHFARQSNSAEYSQLYQKVSEFIRATLKSNAQRVKDPYTEDYAASKPSSTLPNEIVYNILLFLDSSPLTLFMGAPPGGPEWQVFFDDIFASSMKYLVSEDERVRRVMNTVTRRLLSDGSLSFWKRSRGHGERLVIQNVWRSSSVALITLANKLIDLPNDKVMLGFVHDYLNARLRLIKQIPELIDIPDDIPERVLANSKIETALLVALCSTDLATCQCVTKCISLLCEESRIIDSPANSKKPVTPTIRNVDIFNDISAKDFRFTGLVAFQKRCRTKFRQIQTPTAGILSAWETIFDYWLRVSKQIFSRPTDILDERLLLEWRAYSGFLASVGGACVSDQGIMPEDTTQGGLRWIDKLQPEGFDDTLLSRYLKQSIQLLASNNGRIREATRETLSTELASQLYVPLFEHLETELGVLFESPRTNTSLSIESRVTFAEQAASLLKSIVERLGGPAEPGLASTALDIGALTLGFAKFLDDLSEGSSVLRVKIKICQLCETVTQKKELLNLRHDVRIRNQLLEVIFSWIARPGTPRDNVVTAGTRVEELFKLQKDLDRACLKALADLTYRLPLQPVEGQTDADTSDLKSQMFHTYFNRFLSLLNFEQAEIGRSEVRLTTAVNDESMTTSELAISALSNLLSANIDVGLKHSLGIGYHEDLDIRTAFVKVLCNILIQGTDFNNLSDAAVNEKYDELLRLLTTDMALTIALCDACPSTEVDEMTISLLNIFDSRGLGFMLLEALVEHEVEQTENEAELLRRNCVATKMLSVYAKWKGASYLKATLQKVLDRLVNNSDGIELELDPTRVTSQEQLQKNALQLRVIAKVFIDDICNSAYHIPVWFRKICSIISSAVMKRFPEAKFTAVGAFIFLRFFCPAIVAPDVEGLINVAPSKELRRGLLLIAKVVQNLANNVLFGAKEPYMFPLNDFLTQNIYRVTTFLREISVSPTMIEPVIETESFDFGSCVALHRFLYDHWDHVRQKLVIRDRKGTVRTTREDGSQGMPILEALRNLITKLGPPPMDVSWNRPLIANNTPPAYSRFQHFMLRNAGRNTESLVSTRAVYDGGESKDGLPMICIILRNIDIETTDYDLLLFGYLKIASRMWHRPFGILVDATCYSGQNEPQDSLFKKLDFLTPAELTKQLSRFYIYNMNSAFKKCFRRILRLSAKSENSAFHPRNVDYHLLGSLQDLQAHFHLGSLHLPKETISVVSDSRYVFQPITRLSKTKGKIDVTIKVGSQFIQVTTTKKQDIVSGLRMSATTNDIFRISDVDEAPTTIQTEDDSAFGLRTENGKIVMYFTSPRKVDVLQAIRGAKAKFGKELRTLKSFERLVRPQDVPGTLLNIALTNMASQDEVLRLAAYNLLCALCHAFRFTADTKFMSARELCVPLNQSQFIIEISQQLARSEPHLTADFLNEFFVGWESFPFSQRPLSLAYMAPWLHGLRTSLIPTEVDSDKAREKIAAIFRKILDVAISDIALSTTLEQCIWPAISRDEIYTDILLEEIIRLALLYGLEDERSEILGAIISSLDTITIRGKLISRLRKALNRTSLRPTRYLAENAVWGEICILLRLCLATSFDSGVQSQLYLPELFHLVTMLANSGSVHVRSMVQRLLVNTLHAICTTFPLEETKYTRLKEILFSLSSSQGDALFNSNVRDPPNSTQDSHIASLLATENLAVLLSEVSTVAALSIDMSNAWRSRWMSLIASTAFQSNPAIQPRAFTVMGCLAREDVDDDLLYQVLVALRNSISRFMEDNDSEMLIAIITSLTKMMDKLPTASRYGLQLFWLAISLVRLVPISLFNCTALFLEAVLSNIVTSGDLSDGRMVQTLLQGRSLLEDAALQLDDIYGIHFNTENFHFAICALLVKGLTDSITKNTATKVLSTFLKVTSASADSTSQFSQDSAFLCYLGLLLSRVLTAEDVNQNFWDAGMAPFDMEVTAENVMDVFENLPVKDKELLLSLAITIVDFRYLDDLMQNRGLIWLNKVAQKRPTVIMHLSGPIVRILDDVLVTCQNTATLESAHALLRTLTSNQKFSGLMDTSEMLEDVLEGIGFGGLWQSSTFHALNDQERKCTVLTDRLIELIIA